MITKSKTLIAVALLFTIASCKDSEPQYAVISTDLSHVKGFANTEISDLSRNEITILEQLIVECISEYNEEKRKSSELQESELSHYLIMEFNNYKRQYVPVINEIGEKIIWVNAFCSAPNDWDWHTQILGTEDGGNCYYSLSVNITQKTCYGIRVNGYA